MFRQRQVDLDNSYAQALNRRSLLKEIINGCQKRKRYSQKELYKMFYAYGMSITLRYTESREEAVSVLNDSFIKVFDNIKSFKQDKPFKPWLRKIIVNTAINNYHKQKNRIRFQELDHSGSKNGQEEEITSSLSYQELVGLVQELSPAYRTVFNLYVIEGYKHHEIAGMLGISEGTSKSNLAKARINLQSKLERNLSQTDTYDR